jgi:hypothetical protein
MDRKFAGMNTSCQRRAIFFSSLQGCTRHAFPPLQMISINTSSPINFFAPVEYWQNSPNIRSAGQSCRSSGCRLESGGAENRLAAIAVQNFKTLFSAALRPIQQLIYYKIFEYPRHRQHVVLVL